PADVGEDAFAAHGAFRLAFAHWPMNVSPWGAGKSRPWVQPRARGSHEKRPLRRPRRPSTRPAAPVSNRYSRGRAAAYDHAASMRRWLRGVNRASNWRWRSLLSSDGSGMRMGHTSWQRPFRVHALGRSKAASSPLTSGVSTEPMGPEYTQP